MRMQFGLSAFERARGDLPQLPVINMYVEKAALEETGVVLQSRPGLESAGDSLGLGPVDAVFQKDGVLDNAFFAISNGELYKNGVSLGFIDGTGPFFIDGYSNFLFVAGGAGLWGYDGALLAKVTFPDDAPVIKVVVGASRAICLRGDTETFYWSDALSSTIDGLSFATAESQPDRLKDMVFIDDTLMLFGSDTVETWPNTGDADAPFQPLEGRVFSKGVRTTGGAVQFGEGYAWITSDNRICMNTVETVLSNEGLNRKIEDATDRRLWTFYIDSIEFLALTIDNQTYAMPYNTQTWSEFSSYGETKWLCGCFAGGVFGSSIDGRILQFSTAHSDLDGPLERRFRAGFPLNSGGLPVNNLIVRANPGRTPYLSGDYEDPIVECQVSHDAGENWNNWRSAKLGVQGKYRTKVQWTALGMARQPGFLAEFRTTAPVPFRVSDVLVNEPFGGI